MLYLLRIEKNSFLKFNIILLDLLFESFHIFLITSASCVLQREVRNKLICEWTRNLNHI